MMKIARISTVLAVSSQLLKSGMSQQPTDRPGACVSGASADQKLLQENAWCMEMGQQSNSATMTSCCAAGGSDVRRLLQGRPPESECRWVSTDKPYCDENTNPGCSGMLSANDKLTIDLTLSNQGAEGACCDICKCFGDPACISFDGTHDEWVVCDGRNTQCRMRKKLCEDQLDHKGNNCRWLKRSRGYHGWDASGSPCQPDFELSGYPTMTMYDTGSFRIDLTLGERGVIREVHIWSSQGSFVLTADSCFDFDPRSSANPELAWTTEGGASFPSSWTYTTPNPVEIWWHALDEENGIVVDISCTYAEERRRLDIQRLVETNPQRPAQSSGFCSTGSIQQKSGSTALTSTIYNKCLEMNAPNLLVLCKKLVDPACTTASMPHKIEYWCENSDLSLTSASDIDDCKTMLSSGSADEVRRKWTTLVCEANQLNLEQCRTDISQFGWESFLEVHSDGLVSQGNDQYTCTSDWTEYQQTPSTCDRGVRVQYLQGGTWHDALFVPFSKPPCNGKIVLDAEEMPELFANRIRFEQCGLSAACVAQNLCIPTSGFTASVNFETSNCPTPSPTLSPTKSPTPLPTENPTPAPHSFCEDIIEPGNQVTSVPQFGPTFQVVMTLHINKPVCGKGDIPIFQVGCGTPVFHAYMKDCTTDLVFVTASDSNMANLCEVPSQYALPVETPVQISAKLDENGKLTVMYDDTVVCETELEGDALIVQNACVYEGVPEELGPDACITLDVSSQSLTEGECVHVHMNQDFCETLEGPQELGICEAKCPPPEELIPIGDVEPTCRELVIPEPYCDRSNPSEGRRCALLKQNRYRGTFTVKLSIDEDTSTESCCKSCTCFGDPECIAFDGSGDNWLLCDARDSSCSVQEDICGNEIDHAGNNCVWNPSRAEALERRGDIGAIGSPCQPDWATSGPARMVMYSRGDFEASLSAGERGVIEELQIKTSAGTYTLVADKCFSGGSWTNAWEIGTDSVGIQSALRVTQENGPGSDQRTFEIVDPVTRIFIRAICIQRVSKNGKYKNARLDIQNLIEPQTELDASSVQGYCSQQNAVIDKGQTSVSRAQAIHEQCRQSMEPSFLLCRALYSESCSPSDVPEGVKAWCTTANVFPGDPKRVEKCIKTIKPTDKNSNRVAQRWGEMFCRSVQHLRPPGTTIPRWIKQCSARLETDGYAQVVEEYGTGTFSTSNMAAMDAMCGENEQAYGKRTKAQACVPGISIEYQNSKGNWVEELFIPTALQPCDGTLQLSARKHYNLFVNPVRFRQCNADVNECPADIACLPTFGFTVAFQYSQNPLMCPGPSLRAL